LGLIVEKHGLLMATFGRRPDYWCFRITSQWGWVWYSWAKENQFNAMGNLWQRSGKGYVGQESDRLFEQAKRNRKN
jgi:hypothetical protein